MKLVGLMKLVRLIKSIGFIILSLIACFLVGIFLCMIYQNILRSYFPENECPNLYGKKGLGIYLLAIVPSSLLFGSVVTGYFSCYDIGKKKLRFLMVPALYVNLFLMIMIARAFLIDAFTGSKHMGHTGAIRGILVLIAVALYWYLASLAGVSLGYFIRKRFAK
jgi:hypothetical protein